MQTLGHKNCFYKFTIHSFCLALSQKQEKQPRTFSISREGPAKSDVETALIITRIVLKRLKFLHPAAYAVFAGEHHERNIALPWPDPARRESCRSR